MNRMLLGTTALATSVGLLGAPAALASTTTTKVGSNLTLRAASSSVAKGKSDVLSVTLRRAGQPYSGTVSLREKAPGARTFTEVGSIKVTNGKGSSAPIVLAKSGTYFFHVTYLGNATTQGTHSGNVAVKSH